MPYELTTLFTGRRRIDLDKTTSTSKHLSELVRSEALPEGTLVRASMQAEGRGQQGTHWHSAPGKNLLVSFYFRPDFLSVGDVFRLNEAFSLAVSDTVSAFLGRPVAIKWPNDIYVNGEKIAGILIENTISGNRIGSTVLGVGLNVNETLFPSELPNPVSLAVLLKYSLELEAVLHELCNQIERRYLQLKAGHFEDLRAAFFERQYRKGQWALFSDSNGTFEACLTDITREGRLCLEHRDGKIVQYDLKSIRFVLDC